MSSRFTVASCLVYADVRTMLHSDDGAMAGTGGAITLDLRVGGVRKVGETDSWHVPPVPATIELKHVLPLNDAVRQGWIFRWKWYHERNGWQTYKPVESATIEAVRPTISMTYSLRFC